MVGGLEVAVGGHLQQFAEVDDEGARHRRDLQEGAVRALDLEAADGVLEQQRDEAVVLVGADALAGAVRSGAGVADQLEPQVGVAGEGLVVEVGAGADRGEELVQQSAGGAAEVVDPAERGGAQLGERRGPLVGALQPPVRGLAGAGDVRGQLGADVQLVAPVLAAAGALVAGAGVAAVVGELRLLTESRSASGRAKKARIASVSAAVSCGVMPWPTSWKNPTSVAAARSSSCSRRRSSGPPSASERSITGRESDMGVYCCDMCDIRWSRPGRSR